MPEKPGKASQFQPPLAWYEIWARITGSPAVASFESILADHASIGSRRALRWLFASGCAGFWLLLVLLNGGIRVDFLLPWLLMGILYGIVLTGRVIGYTVLVHIAALLAGGTGFGAELIYAFAAFFAPLHLVQSAVLGLSRQPIFMQALWLYHLVLALLAVRAVHHLPWWKTVFVVMAGTVFALLTGSIISI